MGATNLENLIKRHHGEARDGGYVGVPFHVSINDRRRRWWKENFQPRGKTMANSRPRAICRQVGLSRRFFDEVKLLEGGYGDNGSGLSQRRPYMQAIVAVQVVFGQDG